MKRFFQKLRNLLKRETSDQVEQQIEGSIEQQKLRHFGGAPPTFGYIRKK